MIGKYLRCSLHLRSRSFREKPPATPLSRQGLGGSRWLCFAGVLLSRSPLHLAPELAALDEGVDQLQHLAFLCGAQLLDGQQAPAQAAVALFLGQLARGLVVIVQGIDLQPGPLRQRGAATAR